jgi:hypothetical protein
METKQVHLIEAAQKALEFCEFCWRDVPMNEHAFERTEQTIIALRTAIEQAKKQDGWVLREVLFDGGEPIAHREPAQPAPEQYTALEQALTRLQKRYGELEAKVAAQPAPVQEPPCPTCEALARTVMMDQTSHDTTPQHRAPLTDEAVMDIVAVQLSKFAFDTTRVGYRVARAVEAAHGIKENT